MISQKQFHDLAEQVNSAFARMGKRIDELETRLAAVEGSKTKPKPVKEVPQPVAEAAPEPVQEPADEGDIPADDIDDEPVSSRRRSRRERQTA